MDSIFKGLNNVILVEQDHSLFKKKNLGDGEEIGGEELARELARFYELQ